MKYVMMQGYVGTMKKKVPIIFPDFMVHKMVADHAKHILQRDHSFTAVRAISAGIVDLTNGKTFGDSETLGLKAATDDWRVISTYEYTHGV